MTLISEESIGKATIEEKLEKFFYCHACKKKQNCFWIENKMVCGKCYKSGHKKRKKNTSYGPIFNFKGSGWTGTRHIPSKAPTYNDVVRSGAVKPKSYEEYKKENNL